VRRGKGYEFVFDTGWCCCCLDLILLGLLGLLLDLIFSLLGFRCSSSLLSIFALLLLLILFLLSLLWRVGTTEDISVVLLRILECGLELTSIYE